MSGAPVTNNLHTVHKYGMDLVQWLGKIVVWMVNIAFATKMRVYCATVCYTSNDGKKAHFASQRTYAIIGAMIDSETLVVRSIGFAGIN